MLELRRFNATAVARQIEGPDRRNPSLTPSGRARGGGGPDVVGYLSSSSRGRSRPTFPAPRI